MEPEPLDPIDVTEQLAHPPFVQISGVTNARDLGSYITAHPPGIVKPHLLFRSAEISGIDDLGMAQMRDLGIRTIIDLRSDTELERFNTPVPVIRDVEIRRVPVFRKEDYSPEMMAKRYALYASGKTEAFMELYSQILNHGVEAFTAIALHIRDSPSDGCLFHCTAGKDRTGVIAAVFLSLVGVSDQDIAHDYELTRVGREPAREKIMARIAKEEIFIGNTEAANNMLSSRYDTMLAFLEMLRNKYNGAEGYLRERVGLTVEDIVLIRNRMVVPEIHSVD